MTGPAREPRRPVSCARCRAPLVAGAPRCAVCGAPLAPSAPPAPGAGRGAASSAPSAAGVIATEGATVALPGHAPTAPERAPGLDTPTIALASSRRRIPERVERYLVQEELGRGGMGVVYRAIDPTLERDVAVKMIRAGGEDPSEAERFIREARVAAKLRHPGIVGVHEAGTADGDLYIVMDYVRGESLEALLRRDALPPRRLAEVVREVALALQHAHDHGVIHRDVKPQNVLVDEEGRARLADFGLARELTGPDATRRELTVTGDLLGTPAYMAPEQASGQARAPTPAADIWALGGLLYRGLAGRPPFTGPSVVVVLQRVLSTDPTPPREIDPGVPIDLETIALHCLRREPGRRYPSALAVADELARFLAGDPIEARPVGRAEQVGRWVGRNRALASTLAIAGGLITALLVAGIVLTTRSNAAIRVEAERARSEATRAAEAEQDAQREAARTRAALAEAEAARREADERLAAVRAEQALRYVQTGHTAAAWAVAAAGLDVIDSPRLRAAILASRGRTPRLRFATSSGHDRPVQAAALSPDGATLGVVDAGGLAVWDLTTGERRVRIPLELSSASALAVARGGERVAVALGRSGDRVLVVRIGLVDEEIVARVDGPGLAVRGLAFVDPVVDGDGGGDDGPRPPEAGALLAVSKGRLLRIDPDTGAVRDFELGAGQEVLAVGPRGRVVLTGSDGSREVVVRDVDSGVARASVALRAGATAVAIAAGGSRVLEVDPRTQRARFLAPSTGDGRTILLPRAGLPKAVFAAEADAAVIVGPGGGLRVVRGDGRPRLTDGGHGDAVAALLPMRDGRHVVTGGLDGSLRCWDLEGDPAKPIQVLQSDSPVGTLALAEVEGDVLSFHPGGYLIGWRPLADEVLGRDVIADGPLPAFAVSRGGRWLAWVEPGIRRRPRVVVYDTAASGGRVLESERPAGALALSPSGHLVSGHEDGTTRLSDVGEGTELVVIEPGADPGPITHVALDEAARVFALARASGRVEIVERVAGGGSRRVADLFWEGRVTALAMRADGRELLIGDAGGGLHLVGAVVQWSWTRGVHFRAFPAAVTAVAFAADGSLLAGDASGSLRRWALPSGREDLARVRVGAIAQPLAWSDDGAWLALVEPESSAVVVRPADPSPASPGDGGRLDGVASPGSQAAAVAWSPDGSRLAVGSADGGVAIVEVGARRVAARHPGGGMTVTELRWDAAREAVVAVRRDPGLEVVRIPARAGAAQARVARPPDGFVHARLFPDGDSIGILWLDINGRAVVEAADGTRTTRLGLGEICLSGAVRDGLLLRSLGTPGDDQPGALVAVAVATGREVWSFRGFGGIATHIALSPDGQLVAVGDGRGECHLLEMRTGRKLTTIPTGTVRSLVFGPGRLASIGTDGTALLVDLRVFVDAAADLQAEAARETGLTVGPDGVEPRAPEVRVKLR